MEKDQIIQRNLFVIKNENNVLEAKKEITEDLTAKFAKA